jgi:hypothetical protein
MRQTDISAFAARQQAKFGGFSSIEAPSVSASEARKKSKLSISDEILESASFVQAGSASRAFRLGLAGIGKKNGEDEDDGNFSDSSPYEDVDDLKK